ncbi:MAG: DUF1565 domain-containing protein, partial [Candidatus Eisenbacteria bacterium]|nr:DUF1565 domain-containing protein [Candidatus Eisenbacteria bacterium]
DGTGSHSVISSEGNTEGDWVGIIAKYDGNVDLQNARIKHAEVGVQFDNAFPGLSRIEDSHFEGNAVDIKVDYGSNPTQGPRAGTGSPLIKNSTFVVGTQYGIHIAGHSNEATIEGNTFKGANDSIAGILLDANTGTPHIEANTMGSSGFSTGAVLLIKGGEATVEKNTFSDSKYGIHVLANGTAIAAPKIGSGVASSDNFLKDNTSNGLRVEGKNAKPEVRNNQISGNAVAGILTLRKGAPWLGVSGDDADNSIWNNGLYCIWNRDNSFAIQTTGNWFGSCVAPSCTNGFVQIHSWHCSQPASFGGPEIALESTPATGLVLSSNPVVVGTMISYSNPEKVEDLEYSIVDISGRLVKRIPSAFDGSAFWDGSTQRGARASRGIYFIRALSGGKVLEQQKLVLTK